MTKSTKTLLACAALAGIYSGSLATKTYGATHSRDAGTKLQQLADKDKSSCSGKDGCSSADKDKASCKGMHDCKGQNSCKGQGGCKSSDNGCKGKNSCKGKGGCATAKKSTETAPKG
jgi:hypothetical protein